MHVTTGTVVLIILQKKVDSLETKVNCTKDRKVSLENISFDLEKNRCRRPSCLSGKLIVVISEWDKTLAVYDFLKFNKFSSGALRVLA